MTSVYFKATILLVLLNSCSNNDANTDIKKLGHVAESYYQQENYDEAFKAYDSLLKVDSLNPKYYFNRGRCEMILLMLDDSRKDFLKSIELGYRKADAYYNIGVTYIYENDSLVKKYFQECLRVDPNHVEAKFMMGNLKLEEVQ